MKNRPLLLILLITTAATTALFLTHKSAAPSNTPVETTLPAMQKEAVIKINSQPLLRQINPLPQPLPKQQTIPPTNQAQIQTTNSRLENLKSLLELKDVPISFYGHVVDQESNGIADVQVLMSVRQWGLGGSFDSWGNKFPKFNRVTDSGGNFSLENVNGDSLTIESVIKDGYRLSPKAPNGFGYGDVSSPHHPDSQNPVIIKMWKLGEKAQLITGNKFWGIIPDDRTYTMDFLKQTKLTDNNASGDIRVRIIRPAQVKPREKFDWSFDIEGVQGGVIETKDEFLYLAPETGYQPKYEFSMSTNNPNWKREMDGMQFYFQSRDGNVYGWFTFDIIPDYNEQSIFNVKFSANPSGSRNLQP